MLATKLHKSIGISLGYGVLLALLTLATGCKSATTGAQSQEGSVINDNQIGVVSEALLAEADAGFRAVADPTLRAKYEAVAEVAASERAISVQVEALSQVARLFTLEGDLTAARIWLDLAATRADPSLPLGWTRYLGVRGILEREEGDKATAQATFIEMYNFALEAGLHRRAIDAAHHVAIVAPPDEQIAWAHKGIAAAEAGDETGWLGPLWNNLGWTYVDMGRLEEGLEALLKAREYHYASGKASAMAAADRFVGRVYRTMGQLDDAEPYLGTATAASRALYEADASAHNAETLGLSLWQLGELRAAQGKTAAGLSHLREGRRLLIDAGIEEWWADGLIELDGRIAAISEAASGVQP